MIKMELRRKLLTKNKPVSSIPDPGSQLLDARQEHSYRLLPFLAPKTLLASRVNYYGRFPVCDGIVRSQLTYYP